MVRGIGFGGVNIWGRRIQAFGVYGVGFRAQVWGSGAEGSGF